ncbi:mothers against decapentaplegic homolog 6-like [Lampetra fluviatilis]
MFRSKRSVLVRRLWRSRAMGCEEAASAEAAAAAAAALVTAAASSSSSTSSSSTSSSSSAATAAVVATAAGSLCSAFWPPCGGGGRERRDRERDRDPPNELKAITFSVLERLSERHLEALASAVESKGAASSGCVHVPVLPGDLQRQQQQQQQSQVTSTVLFLCRLFRWPDVRHQRELKRLCCCDSFGQTDAETVCCNPYHLSKMWQPDSPPPPYSRFPQESSKLQELSHTTLMTTEAEGTELSLLPGLRGTFLPPDVQKAKPWCTLAYWEYKKRLGPLHHVCRDTVGVYYELPHQASPGKGSGAADAGEDLCLKSLPLGSGAGGGVGGQTAQRSRARVGAGLLVSCEPDGVWAYNRGELPVFVNSMTLDTTVGRAPVSHRLPTGHSVKIFDPEQARSMQRALARLAQGERPRDLYSVRISFGKGWGRDYSRQCVLDCPCWLELFFYR